MTMPLVDLLIVTNLHFDSAGKLLLSTQYVQIFVLVSVTLFVGVNIIVPNLVNSEGFLAPLNIIGIFIGLIFFLISCIFAPFYTSNNDVYHAIIILSFGLVPLFGFMAVFTFLESIGRESAILKISIRANVANVLLDIFLIFILNAPVIAVVTATSIIRSFMYLEVLGICRRMKYPILTNNLKTYVLDLIKVLRIGGTQSISGVLFMLMFILTVRYLDGVWDERVLSEFSVALNYMNIMFAIGMAAVVTVSVNYSDMNFTPAKKKYKYKYFYDSLAYLAIVTLFFVSISPIFAFANGGYSSLTYPLILASIAVFFDLMSMIYIVYLRIGGIIIIPPYIRLTLFIIIFIALINTAKPSLTEMVLYIAIGNLASLAVLILICSRVCSRESPKYSI